jgi:transposase
MAATNFNKLPDIDLNKLNIHKDDKITCKLLMLIEGTYGIGVQESIKKYGYTEQRFYQLKKEFMEKGSEALIDEKRGPKDKSQRKEQIQMQIIRMRFLDPQANSDVIAQKLNQMGIKISRRSVERTITQYGLQKKTFSTKS